MLLVAASLFDLGRQWPGIVRPLLPWKRARAKACQLAISGMNMHNYIILYIRRL